ncbi:hypothetical protein AGMMS49965_12060 [Bacteroidia bacterium]|nr:hypothetical protein AGMMS49965_12060 [Bacteroidia bacterium]
MIARAQFTENFSDGAFTGAGRSVNWTGDADRFVVNDVGWLQLNATEAATVQLRTPSTLAKGGEWTFRVKMPSPSASNYVKVYLTSDKADLTGELSGLFIRIGYSDDNICLIRQNGKTNSILITGEKKRLDLSTVDVALRATWDAAGNLSLYSKLDSEANWTLEGAKGVDTAPTSNWFGLVCFFTKTNAKKYSFDDFVAKPQSGSVPNPKPDPTPDPDPTPEPTPDPDPTPDPTPNPDPDPSTDGPQAGDIVFSEIMANPGTGSSKPEYVEFYNATDRVVQLKDCQFLHGTTACPLPESSIEPHDYLVLSKSDATGWFPAGINRVEATKFPTLTNTGKVLQLKNAEGTLIAEFEYSDAMYKSSAKKTSGGYSLECIDLSNVSNSADNWLGSLALGGTPGKPNSVAGSTATAGIDAPNALWLEYPSGNNSQYTIHYQLDRAGYTARLFIYDLRGLRVATVLNNAVLSSSGTVNLNADGRLRSGIYIIYMEAFDAAGNVQRFKKPMVMK